jgi:hypothetical protein
MRYHVESKHIDLDGKKGGLHTESLKYSSHGSGLGKHRVLATGALKLQQGGGSNVSTGGIKTTGIKTTGIKVTGVGTTGIKAPTIPTPVVRTPNVKVNVRTPNIRVPNVAIHVR